MPQNVDRADLYASSRLMRSVAIDQSGPNGALARMSAAAARCPDSENVGPPCDFTRFVATRRALEVTRANELIAEWLRDYVPLVRRPSPNQAIRQPVRDQD
jgi:hypothetical protein